MWCVEKEDKTFKYQKFYNAIITRCMQQQQQKPEQKRLQIIVVNCSPKTAFNSTFNWIKATIYSIVFDFDMEASSSGGEEEVVNDEEQVSAIGFTLCAYMSEHNDIIIKCKSGKNV